MSSPHNSTEALGKISLCAFLTTFLLGYALNFSLGSSFRIATLIGILSYFVSSRKFVMDTVDHSEYAIKILLCIIGLAFGWTLTVSFDSIFLKLLSILFTIFILCTVRSSNLSQLLPANETGLSRVNNRFGFLQTLLLVCIVLFIRGWWPSIFIAVSLALIQVYKHFELDRQMSKSIHTVQIVFCTASLFVGAFASRISIKPESSMFWISYDQIYRASIATGLTRWGFTNSNFGFGQRLPYHWLGESISGFIARIGGISEASSISRLSPVLGLSLGVFVIVHFSKHMEISSLYKALIVVAVTSVGNLMDLNSIGTLWGGSIYLLTALYWANLISQEVPRHVSTLLMLLILFVTLSQNLLGLSLAAAIVVFLAIRFLSNSLKFKTAIVSIMLIAVSIFGIELLFFRGSIYNNQLNFGIRHWLQYPAINILIGGAYDSGSSAIHLNSLFYIMYLFSRLALCFWAFSRHDYLGKLSKFFGIQMFVAIIAVNVLNFGEFTGKFLVPVFLLGSLVGSLTIGESINRRLGFLFWLTLVLVLAGLHLKRFRVPLINHWNGVPYLLLTLCAFICSVIGLYFARKSRASGYDTKIQLSFKWILILFFLLPRVPDLSSIPTFSKKYEMSIMFGDRNLQKCMQFIRENTPKDSIVSTSLWKIPNGVDEKYFLTSLQTGRRVLLDGPYYSQILAWPSKQYFEHLKDLHTNFSNSLDPLLAAKIRSLGADYFLLDTRVSSEGVKFLDFQFADVVYANSECSIIKL